MNTIQYMYRIVQCINLDYFITHNLLNTIQYEYMVNRNDHIFIPFKCTQYNKIILRMPKLMNILDTEAGRLSLPLYTNDTSFSTAMQHFFQRLEKRAMEELEGLEVESFSSSVIMPGGTTNILYRTGILQLDISPNTLFYDTASKSCIEQLQKNRAVQVILHVAGLKVANGVAALALEPLLIYQFETSQQEEVSDDEEAASDFSSNISDYSSSMR